MRLCINGRGVGLTVFCSALGTGSKRQVVAWGWPITLDNDERAVTGARFRGHWGITLGQVGGSGPRGWRRPSTPRHSRFLGEIGGRQKAGPWHGARTCEPQSQGSVWVAQTADGRGKICSGCWQLLCPKEGSRTYALVTVAIFTEVISWILWIAGGEIAFEYLGAGFPLPAVQVLFRSSSLFFCLFLCSIFSEKKKEKEKERDHSILSLFLGRRGYLCISWTWEEGEHLAMETLEASFPFSGLCCSRRRDLISHNAQVNSCWSYGPPRSGGARVKWGHSHPMAAKLECFSLVPRGMPVKRWLEIPVSSMEMQDPS